MRDKQHRLGRRLQLLFQPPLAGDVEVVVRLIEQEDVVRAPQQRLEHEALLLAAREGGEVAKPRPLERQPQRGDGALVPYRLVLVASGVRVVGERGRVPQLCPKVVVLDDPRLGRVEFEGCLADAARRDLDEQLVDRGARAAVADELVHDAEGAPDRHCSGVRGLVAADDAQQRRLAGAVRADQRGRGAFADAERDLVQQRPAVGEAVRDCADVDVAHARSCMRPRVAASVRRSPTRE